MVKIHVNCTYMLINSLFWNMLDIIVHSIHVLFQRYASLTLPGDSLRCIVINKVLSYSALFNNFSVILMMPSGCDRELDDHL